MVLRRGINLTIQRLNCRFKKINNKLGRQFSLPAGVTERERDRRSRGYQGKMPEWETMPRINSGADGSFDGGNDGGPGGFDGGFDGLDGGAVGVAEADGSRVQKR